MKLQVLCVRDIRAGVFGNPFFMSSVGQAERQFGDEINRMSEDNVMYKHPEDFELYQLGSFDTDSALFVLLDRPMQICEGRSMVRAQRGDSRQLPLEAVN